MLAWTWGTWPDPIVDFGRELYVPWQLTQGKILYRDIAYFNGPLSPYFNAAVFEIFGVSLRSLEIVNIILLAALTWMIWHLWRLIADEFTATIACIVLLCVFSFLRLSGIGNYNFITPYSHEITHGIVLSFAALTCIATYLRRGEKRWIAIAGGILGLIFLTKPEIFAAALPAVGVGAILANASRQMPARKRWRTLWNFLVPLLGVPMVAMFLLWTKLPLRQALRGVAGAWVQVMNPQITSMRFYRFTMGTLDWPRNVGKMLEEFGWYLVIGLLIAVLACMLRSAKRQTAWIAFVIGALAMVAIFRYANIDWEQAFRGLSVAILIIAMVMIARSERTPRQIMQITVCLFALFLIGKIALNLRTHHYGFALAMPAMLVSVAAALSWLPNRLEKFGCSKPAFRAAALAVVGLIAFVHLSVFARFFAKQPVRVGGGGDAFYADARGAAVNQIVSQLAQLPSSATLAVVPEGVMINFLSRRENPTGYINLMPPEVMMFGQSRIVESFQAHAPDFILLVYSDPSDYGYRSFSEYGGEIDRWIQSNYIPMPTASQPALPMRLMKHK
jgi:hypothetical protein